ncbi:MAG: T9SS type A sorting domain-containing protein, partial [Gemmatimonadales bacterium]
KVIQFVNLPADCIIRIYSSSGVLVTLVEHHSSTLGGKETWNVLNRNNQVVASGVYFYHIEAGDARRVGRFTVVNFAE